MEDQLSRVQVYLNPKDVSAIDEIAKGLRIKRSQIIRDATKAVALRYLRAWKAVMAGKKGLKKRNPLLDLIGIERSKTGTAGLNVDEIYKTL